MFLRCWKINFNLSSCVLDDRREGWKFILEEDKGREKLARKEILQTVGWADSGFFSRGRVKGEKTCRWKVSSPVARECIESVHVRLFRIDRDISYLLQMYRQIYPLQTFIFFYFINLAYCHLFRYSKSCL